MGSITQNLDEILDDDGFVKGSGGYYIGGHKPVPIGTVYRGPAFRGRRQSISKVGQDSQILDESLENFKKPKSDLDVKQRIASTGETVPIVFGHRLDDKNIGGVWIQPSLLKAGTFNFRQSYLFAISQGEIVSSPTRSTSYTGTKKIQLLTDQTITTTNIFNSAATLAASPNTCPIQGTGLFCGYENYSYLTKVIPASSGDVIIKVPDLKKDYFSFNYLTVGTGDTSNSRFTVSTQVFDAETGVNVTNNIQANTPLFVGPGVTTFTYNTRRDGPNGLSGNLLGGFPVGHILSLINITNGALGSPFNATTVAAGIRTQADLDKINAMNNGKSQFYRKFTFSSVNNQVLATNPASTGTLTGVQVEYIIANRSNINVYTGLDNSSYADITFLSIAGQLVDGIYEGTYPSDVKQVYVFYAQGVKVDLYSQGLSGSSYQQGASNQFVDLAMHLFKIYKKIDGNNTADIVAPVDTTNLQSLALFNHNNDMYFNGFVSKSVNIIDYITSIAPYYFLAFLSVGGKYKFAPTLPINSSNQFDTTALTPVATFTEANIINNTFEKIYLNVEDRREFIANVIYTHCVPSEVSKSKTVTLRFSSTSLDAPTEQFDISECCSSVNHAILYAKYELARRKHSSHDISFSTPLVTTTIIPTNLIKVQLQRENSAGDNRTEINYYQVTSITYDNNGISNIQASHFPLDASNVSEITKEMLTGTFTTLQ
tara:strand:+ start:2490 stop:4625 length:2136 start_codon:yes stop_codon:yes gene_type:complete